MNPSGILQAVSSVVSEVPKKSVGPLSPLVQHKYYDTPGKQLLFDFINAWLCVEIIGFQAGHGHIPDQILFRSPKTGSTLSAPCSVMLLSHEQAVEVIQTKIKINGAAFRG